MCTQGTLSLLLRRHEQEATGVKCQLQCPCKRSQAGLSPMEHTWAPHQPPEGPSTENELARVQAEGWGRGQVSSEARTLLPHL